jgi:hypothetical protein
MTPEQIQFCSHVEQGERELAQALLSNHENLLFQTDEFGMNPVLVCITLKHQIETSAASAAAAVTDTALPITSIINSLVLEQLTAEKLKVVLEAINTHILILDCVREFTEPMRTWFKASKLFLEYAKTRKDHGHQQTIDRLFAGLSTDDMTLLSLRIRGLNFQNKPLPTILEDIEGEEAAMAARNPSSATNDPVLYRRRTYGPYRALQVGKGNRPTGSMPKQPLADLPLRVVHSDESVPQSSSSKPNL